MIPKAFILTASILIALGLTALYLILPISHSTTSPSLAGGGGAAASKKAKKNVILIVADDLGWKK